MKRGDFFVRIPKMYVYQIKAPFTEMIEDLHQLSGWFIKSTRMGICSETGDTLFKDLFRNKQGQLFTLYRKESLVHDEMGIYRVHYSVEPFHANELVTN